MAGEQFSALGFRVSPHGNSWWSDESEVGDQDELAAFTRAGTCFKIVSREDEDECIEILSSCSDDEDRSELEAKYKEVLKFERYANSVDYSECYDKPKDIKSDNEGKLCVVNSSCEECAGNKDIYCHRLQAALKKLHDMKKDKQLYDKFVDFFNLLLETTAYSVQDESGESPPLELEEVALSPTEIRFPDGNSSSFFACEESDADCSEIGHPVTPSTSDPVSDVNEFTDVSDAMSGDDANPQNCDTSQDSASTDLCGPDLERISAPSDGGVGKQSLKRASVKRSRRRFKAFRSKSQRLAIVATAQLLAPASFRLVLRRSVITPDLPEPFWEMFD